jgi:hypothetical protein
MKFINSKSKKSFFVNRDSLVKIKGLREWVRVIDSNTDDPYIRVHERNSFGETIYLKETHEEFDILYR